MRRHDHGAIAQTIDDVPEKTPSFRGASATAWPEPGIVREIRYIERV